MAIMSHLLKECDGQLFKGIPRTPTMHDLFIAIVRAKKVDDEQPFSTPNILYTLMKGVATNIEHMQTICDGFHSHFGKQEA